MFVGESGGGIIRRPRSPETPFSLCGLSPLLLLHAFPSLESIHSPLITMLSRAARPAIALARTANQQQAGMATLKEIEQRCVGRFRPGDTERGKRTQCQGRTKAFGGNGILEPVLIYRNRLKSVRNIEKITKVRKHKPHLQLPWSHKLTY